MSFLGKFLKIALLFGVALVMSGCFVFSLFAGGPDVDLAKSQWRIASFINSGTTYEPKDYENVPQIRFDTQEMKLYGNTGCNTFFASYEWIDDRIDEETKKPKSVIEIRNSGMTRKLCSSEAIMRFEQKLMEEFDGEFEVVENGDKLELKKPELEIYLSPYDPEEEGGKKRTNASVQ